MTPEQFRKLALALPEAVESSHHDHPDFRVGGKIFATLSPVENTLGMVKLTPDQQDELVAAEPSVFAPVPGAWGERGATHVRLAAAKSPSVRRALEAAWRNTAPKRLTKD